MNTARPDESSADIVAMLRGSIERYTAEHYSFDRRWAALNSARGYSEQAWREYANMGWLALRMPEDLGGLAAGADVTAPLMEAVGERLLLEPILASTVIATGLIVRIADAELHRTLLPAMADGSLQVALAHNASLDATVADSVRCEYRDGKLFGSKTAVLHGGDAHRLIASALDANGRLLLCLVDIHDQAVERRSFKLLDGRGAANFEFHRAPAQVLGAPETHASILELALAEASVALCSEALGVVRALNQATTQYLKTRKQFGKPIGTNQALQHRMVEMYVLEQEIRSLSKAAQRALHACGNERQRMVSGARAFTCAAVRHVAAEAVQMHGGIGISDELEVSHYYRRAMVIGTLFGNRDLHLTSFIEAAA